MPSNSYEQKADHHDSLRNVISNGLQIHQFESAIELFKIFTAEKELDSARHYVYYAKFICRGPNQLIEAEKSIARYFNAKDRPDSSRFYNKKVIELAITFEKTEIHADALTDLGRGFYVEGMYDSAMVYYFKALDIFEKNEIISKKRGWLLHYIGSVYKRQDFLDKACEFYEKELLYSKRNGFQDVYGDALYLNAWCMEESNPKEALEMRLLSLDVFKTLGNKNMQALLFDLIGSSYKSKKDYQLALIYQFKGLKMREEAKDASQIAASLESIGGVYLAMGQHDKAIEYFNSALTYARNTNRKRHIRLMEIYANLSITYSEIGQYDKAYAFELLKEVYEDSVIFEQRRMGVNELTIAYEISKKENEIELLKKTEELREIEIANQEAQVEREKESNEMKTMLMVVLIGGLLIILIATFFIFKRLKISRKQTQIIENQKKIVDEKNQEIIDSIHYAKRIQAAVLPSDELMKEHLSNAFVFYRPKDIVAGDFYWMEPLANGVLIAAADCTGHGVPGAMVSVVCNNGLNRSVREYGLTCPGDILDKTREIVIQEFARAKEDVKDGMDIALLRLLKENSDTMEKQVLEYAGAHNPLWIIRKGSHALEEIKANKQPIGQFRHAVPFRSHRFELNKGDTIYVFSDGFIDQFGGPKGKKFKTVNFRKLILSIQNHPMRIQKQLLEEAFDRWKKNLEQLDDVCVIGIRV